VFAAGDVRSGSVKRVASAVGEGALAVTLVHAHLAAADGEPPPQVPAPRRTPDGRLTAPGRTVA
jgi:thioredoxin reductase (NADPH)